MHGVGGEMRPPFCFWSREASGQPVNTKTGSVHACMGGMGARGGHARMHGGLQGGIGLCVSAHVGVLLAPEVKKGLLSLVYLNRMNIDQ